MMLALRRKESSGYVVGAELDMETSSKGKQVLFFLLILLDKPHILDIFI